MRSRHGRLVDDPPFDVAIKSPGDSVLPKLQWYDHGGRASEQPWRDVRSLLNIAGPSLDQDYLHRWPAGLGLTDLLERAGRDALA